jgi:uncharacterized protein YndB with AHSA1/START domain
MAAAASAEVLDSSAAGFTVKTTLTIKASPGDVYSKLIHNIGDWWNPNHTFSRDARNLRLEDHPGGCLCEVLAPNGFSRHMEVIFAAPDKRLVLSGALGPMQSMAAGGTLTIQVAPVDGGTKFEATYAVHGYFAKGMDTFAAPVDMVIADQFTRLKNYVETGHPTTPATSR